MSSSGRGRCPNRTIPAAAGAASQAATMRNQEASGSSQDIIQSDHVLPIQLVAAVTKQVLQ